MAQESSFYHTPWIQEIKLPSHYSHIPNESFFIDHLGHLFIGNANGLNIVYGNRSLYLHMEGPVLVTGNGSDTLCYASRNDVGFLLMDEKGGFNTLSCKSWIDADHRNFIPDQLVFAANNIFLNTEKGVYQLRNGHSSFFSFKNTRTSLHVLDNDIFLGVEGKGLQRWNSTRFFDYIPETLTGDNPVILIGRERDHLEILTSRGELFQVADTDIVPVRDTKFPGYDSISFIAYLNDRMLLLDDMDKGLSILDRKGETINHLGSKEGLPFGNTIQIFKSEDNETWILSPHSLHKLNYPSSLNRLDISPFETGRILASLIIDDRIILGTSDGVYCIEKKDPFSDQWKLRKLSEAGRESIHILERTGNQVFAAGSRHLYSIVDNQLEMVAEGNFTGLKPISENRVIVSNTKGISGYSRNETAWDKNDVDLSLPSSHSFVEHKGNIFFLCNNGIYRLSRNLNGVVSIPFHMDDMVFRILPADGQLYLVGANRVFRYEKNEETFLTIPWDQKAEVLSGIDVLIPHTDGDYWIVQHDGKYRSRVINTLDLDVGAGKFNFFPVLQNLGEIIDLAIVDSVLYITGKDMVSLFDLRIINKYQGKVPLRINTIRSDVSGTINLDLPGSEKWFTEEGRILLSHANKKVEFTLAGMEYQSMPEPLFRFMIPPKQYEWSDWSNDRKITLRDFRYGDYTFIAQAKDLYGRISEPVKVGFIIKPPIYRTWYAYVVYGLVLLIVLFLIQKWRLLGYQRAETRVSQRMQTKLDDLTVEKEKSDKLVAEILPEKTAAQIKSQGKAKWDKYERATVLFSDIQGFTRIAEEMNPEALIDELDKFFFHFDSVVEKYNIEKIKTIGDAYMAAGGIPEKNSTNPVEVVLAALEMQTYMQQLKSAKTDIWDLRIGIHTGPVIAGVVGHKKVSYDIWGDTVNTASRMESSGMAGKVNISGITYGMVKEYFICEYRGKLPVKYKGNIDMYFVNGLRPELSVDLKGIPNKRFFTKLQLLRLGDLEDRIFENVLNELPSTLYFHRLEYARKVYSQSFLLCRAEEIEQEERLLVRTAAMLLFTGLSQSYNNYENRSSVLAREILPDYSYSESQIDQICNLILATKQPFNPINQLERIIIDAKMEFIGRPDYPAQIKLLFKELQEAGAKINGQQFKKQQLELLYEFEYFTIAGKRLREVSGPDQMSTLEQERWV